MTIRRKFSLTVTALGAALLLGGCGTQLEGARTTFGYSGLVGGDPSLSTYEQAKADFLAARYGLAVKRFQLAMAEEPESVEAANGLAAAYDQVGRFDLAERFYRRALAMEPDSVQTLNNLGYSLMLQGKHDLALAFFRDAARIEPDNAVIASNAEQAVAARMQARDQDPAEATAAAAPQPAAEAARAAAPAPSGPRILRVKASEQHLELQPLPVMAVMPPPPSVPAVPLMPVETQPLPDPAEPAEPLAAAAPVVQRPSVYLIRSVTGQDAVVSAGPSESHAAAVDLSGSIEVANGAGRRHMAARMRSYLAGLGLAVERLRNADHFGYTTTAITYRPGHRELAESLSASLPVAPLLQQVTEQSIDVRVLLGGDLLEFDGGLLKAERKTSHADAV